MNSNGSVTVKVRHNVREPEGFKVLVARDSEVDVVREGDQLRVLGPALSLSDVEVHGFRLGALESEIESSINEYVDECELYGYGLAEGDSVLVVGIASSAAGRYQPSDIVSGLDLLDQFPEIRWVDDPDGFDPPGRYCMNNYHGALDMWSTYGLQDCLDRLEYEAWDVIDSATADIATDLSKLVQVPDGWSLAFGHIEGDGTYGLLAVYQGGGE